MAEKKDNKDAKEVEKVAETPSKAAPAKKTTAAKSTTAKKTTTASKATAAKPSTAAAKPATAKKTTTASKPAGTAAKPATAKKPATTATKSTAAKTTTAKKPSTAAAKSTTAKKTTTAKAKPVKAEEPAEVKTEDVVDVTPAIQAEEAVEVAPVVKAEETVAEVKPAEVKTEEAKEPVQSAEVTAEANDNKSGKPTFLQKTKGAFAGLGNKIKTPCVNAAQTVKGWFKKDEPVAASVGSDGVAVADGDMKTILAGGNLSKKEKFVRFCRSQSGWLFVLPAVILLCIFTLYPIFNAFIRAFMENYQPTNKKTPYEGWGFENFVRVLKGDTGMGGANFWQCLLNTFIVTIISVPLSIVFALLIAVALNSIKAVRNAYQTILFLPYLTNALAMGAVFATFFQIIGTKANTETVGIVNNILEAFGINPIDWLNPSKHAWGTGTVKFYWASYTTAIIYDVWSGLPFKILILFSSLQSVNKQYYDAAKVDGASKTKILCKITAPMISPMLSYLFITGIMGGMKSYTSIVGLFGVEMGTNFNMGTVVGYIYQYIDKGQMGYAFAGSLLLFVIIMIITGISNYISKKRVTYT